MHLMHLPVYTALSASALMIMQIILMGMVVARRGKTETMIGDGGNAEMEQSIRVHGNLVENSPIFLIGLGLVELITGSTMVVACIGGIFVVSRIAHAVGYSMTSGISPGRLLGSLGTMIMTFGTAVYLAYLALMKL